MVAYSLSNGPVPNTNASFEYFRYLHKSNFIVFTIISAIKRTKLSSPQAGLILRPKLHWNPVAIRLWANVGNGRQRRWRFANIGPTLATQPITWYGWQMVGNWLVSQCCIANPMPTLDQCWKSDHKLAISQNCWGMVGKWSASQDHTANHMPLLDQH